MKITLSDYIRKLQQIEKSFPGKTLEVETVENKNEIIFTYVESKNFDEAINRAAIAAEMQIFYPTNWQNPTQVRAKNLNMLKIMISGAIQKIFSSGK